MFKYKKQFTTGEVLTETTKKAIEESYLKLQNVISELEKSWKVKFSMEEIFDRYHYYSVNFGDYFFRIGGDTLSGEKHFLIVNNKNGEVAYNGVLRDDVNYYIRLINSFKKKTSMGHKVKLQEIE